MIAIWYKRKGITQINKRKIENYKRYIGRPEALPTFEEDVVNSCIKSLESKGALEVLDAEEAYERLEDLAAAKEKEEKEKAANELKKEIEEKQEELKKVEPVDDEEDDDEDDEADEADEDEVTLEAVNNEMTFKELQTVAKEKSLSGYTTKDKAGLQELIIEELELEG